MKYSLTFLKFDVYLTLSHNHGIAYTFTWNLNRGKFFDRLEMTLWTPMALGEPVDEKSLEQNKGVD